MYQVVEYFNYNPDATAAEAVSYFEEQFEIAKHVKALNDEADEISKFRKELRPLYAERTEITEKVKYILSEIEMEVYMEFPPRKGTDTQRESMRNELKKNNSTFNEHNNRLKVIGLQISDLENQVADSERRAKNARRLTELLQAYILFITEYKFNINQTGTSTTSTANKNMF